MACNFHFACGFAFLNPFQINLFQFYSKKATLVLLRPPRYKATLVIRPDFKYPFLINMCSKMNLDIRAV